MAFPKTLDELRSQGYVFIEHAPCRGEHCTVTIEWWKTPKGKRMPMDVDAVGNVKAHWTSCVDAEDFRR